MTDETMEEKMLRIEALKAEQKRIAAAEAAEMDRLAAEYRAKREAKEKEMANKQG